MPEFRGGVGGLANFTVRVKVDGKLDRGTITIWYRDTIIERDIMDFWTYLGVKAEIERFMSDLRKKGRAPVFVEMPIRFYAERVLDSPIGRRYLRNEWVMHWRKHRG